MNTPSQTTGEVVFIFSVMEVYHYLRNVLYQFDNHEQMIVGALCNLIEDVLGTEESRDPVGSNFEEAVRQMHNAGLSPEKARAVAISAGDQIIDKATAVVPNLGSEVYKNAYEYFYKEPFDVYIHIHKSVFEKESSQIRGRPYRL